MLKHYVEFSFPGILVVNTSAEEIANRDANIEWPERAYAYRIFDLEEVEKDGEVLRGRPKNYSPRVIRGEIWSLDRIKKEMPNERILIQNIEFNEKDTLSAVKCITGNWIGLQIGDIVVGER